jgi:hypothetical protein
MQPDFPARKANHPAARGLLGSGADKLIINPPTGKSRNPELALVWNRAPAHSRYTSNSGDVYAHVGTAARRVAQSRGDEDEMVRDYRCRIEPEAN